MSKLSYVNPDFIVKKNIAVVGSSGSLLSSKLGSVIDGYEVVVRFNRAPVEGYEEDVGSKTSLRVCNLGVFLNRPSSDMRSGQPENFIRDRKDENILFYYADKFEEEWEEGKSDVEKNGNMPYRMEYLEFLKERNGAIGAAARPLSMGVGFALLLIFSNIVPVLFGFDIDILERSHYWENRPKTTINHDISFEQNLLKKLSKEKKIIIC